MVAFEGVVAKKSYLEKKKHNKKKIHKIDISDPVLLSPSTFKKHKCLLDVKKTNSKSTEELVSSSYDENRILQDENEKEKRKSFNKKIKEIKKKKNKRNSNVNKYPIKNRSYETGNNFAEPNTRNENSGEENNKISSNDYKESTKKDMDLVGNIKNDETGQTISCKENKENHVDDYAHISNNEAANYQESCRNDQYIKNYFTTFLENKILFPSSCDITEEVEERQKLMQQYIVEKKELEEIIIRIVECNINISEKEEQMRNFSKDIDTQSVFSECITYSNEFEEKQEDDEYSNICAELEGVQNLLHNVTESISKQKKKISKNLAILDKLDIEMKTKKTLFVDLKRGKISSNSLMAPRSLLNDLNDAEELSDDEKSFV